jgi:hypothetical protein
MVGTVDIFKATVYHLGGTKAKHEKSQSVQPVS